MDSAILPAYNSIGIHADHMNMTKFASEDDPGFVSVVREIRRWVKALKAFSANSEDTALVPVAARAAGNSVVHHYGDNTGGVNAVYGGNQTFHGSMNFGMSRNDRMLPMFTIFANKLLIGRNDA
jgi:hypothetical protein